MSDLHSIFYSSQQLQSFIKLCSDEPLHQLHAEFWGKRVEDEAAEWWASPNPCIVTDRSLEAKTNKDPGNDEFEDDDESGDHEAPPGSNCYVLTIDTPLPIRRKILVRNEYAHIYDCFETRYDKSLAGDTTPITVLTGQPGIGKSLWLIYALCRRLSECKPVLWYLTGRLHLFVTEGVLIVPCGFEYLRFKQVVWTLVDADDTPKIPEELVAHSSRLFVIHTTSPMNSRWARLHEMMPDLAVFVMNPWSRREIHIAASLAFSAPNWEAINTIYNDLGPTPRLCIDLLESGAVESYKHTLEDHVRTLDPEQYLSMVSQTCVVTLEDMPENLFLVTRADPSVMDDKIKVEPITWFVASRLVAQFTTVDP